MEDLSLHILDIVENSIRAGAKNVGILVREEVERDLLTIEVTDDGKGIGQGEVERVTDPFYTTRTTRRVGLGVALLAQAARDANGSLDVWSVPGVGTKIRATFQRSHIDRKPLGEMAETIEALLLADPGIEITFVHQRNGARFVFDTRKVRPELDADSSDWIPLLPSIKRRIAEGLKALSD